ncbi:MAG TPA: PASTA domain-containing protein [Nitrospirae bacterium]|nr:serine/threonine-protein kinase PrkC [bacterium BMS3Abin06]HDH12031.1 PASTA domain-containing protein [Nitrospirota bacterium]HDZ00851.1 PASTA domain-containing protein [Nitrospirota bacterium]
MIKNIVKLFFYFIAFVVVGAVAAYLVFQVVNFDKGGEVPLLVGKSVTEAAELLNKRKLFLSIKGKYYHDEIPEGYIIEQKTEPGERIQVGTDVEVLVSKGHEIYSMPSFEGQILEDAKLTLINLDMQIKKVTRVHSDSVSKGVIIAQRPLPGNISSNEINFLVSLGPYKISYRCPSFVDMTIDDARILAEELGVKLIEKERGSRVIFQKPEAGALINKGDSVEIKLGRGWGMWF